MDAYLARICACALALAPTPLLATILLQVKLGTQEAQCWFGRCLPGAVVTYTCVRGYKLTYPDGSLANSHTMTCGDGNGVWANEALFTCQYDPLYLGEYVLGRAGQSCTNACNEYGLSCEVSAGGAWQPWGLWPQPAPAYGLHLCVRMRDVV